MRLLERLDDGSFRLTDNLLDPDIARCPYAILSHRWGNEEVTLEDIVQGSPQARAGYEKIKFCGDQADNDGLKYFWVDSCCIRKSSDAELSEAINSMYRWYSRAARCYVYLSDVSVATGDAVGDDAQMSLKLALRNSEWFTRGWTLQELLAPGSVEFFSRERERLGDKQSLSQEIHEITGIELRALRGASMSHFCVSERFKWAQNRITTREEDWAYSLLGIFGVSMPLLYGEGKERAVFRLRQVITEALEGSRLSAPKPSSNVPFRRDPDFVDRGDILDQIDQRCSEPAGRAALVGLGGVGKSQLAIEYSHRVRERSPQTWLFWVHAGTQARFEEGYRRIAEAAKVPGWDDPKVDILLVVRRWLCDESNGRWIMIIDNADDSRVLLYSREGGNGDTSDSSSRSNENLSAFLPQTPNGSILITTRNREAAFQLTGRSADILDVGLMEQSDAVALARKKLRAAHEDLDVIALVQALEYIPLAITQAAAYIDQRAPRMTIAKYVHNLYKGENDRARLLDTDVGDMRRDGKASNSIMATWQMSFEYIRKERPSATRLLSLMSLFDRQGIPETLLVHRYQSTDIDRSEFEDDVSMLVDFSLISIQTSGTHFEMHRLVQFSTKRWLRLNDELEEWVERYVKLISKSFPSGAYENWATCRELYPHARAIIEYRPTHASWSEDWSVALYKISWYAYKMGNYQAALKMGVDALEAAKDTLGEDSLDILTYMDNVARTQKILRNYSEAEAMQRRVLAGREKQLGLRNPTTLSSIYNLAKVLRHQKKYREAESLIRRALLLYEEELGLTHPDTLACMGLLGRILRRQGKYSEAEAMNRRALLGCEQQLGPDHPETLSLMHNLAHLRREVGENEEAISMMETCVERSKKVLGLNHPYTTTSVVSLDKWRRGRMDKSYSRPS